MHLLSDCRQNNNLTKGSGLCKAGWPVNKKPGGEKSVRWRRGKPNVGFKGELDEYTQSTEVGIGLKEVCEALSHDSRGRQQ